MIKNAVADARDLSPRQRGLLALWISRGRIQSAGDVPKDAILVDPDAISSRSAFPNIPIWYEDKAFVCKECRRREVWTARQQHWWYEVAKGEIESTAVLCRACRLRKRKVDATMTESARRFREMRAARKAASIAAGLSARGKDGFGLLDQPVSHLMLRRPALEKLNACGLNSIGDLVGYSGGSQSLGLRSRDLAMLKEQLAALGLCIAGARVPRLATSRRGIKP